MSNYESNFGWSLVSPNEGGSEAYESALNRRIVGHYRCDIRLDGSRAAVILMIGIRRNYEVVIIDTGTIRDAVPSRMGTGWIGLILRPFLADPGR